MGIGQFAIYIWQESVQLAKGSWQVKSTQRWPLLLENVFYSLSGWRPYFSSPHHQSSFNWPEAKRFRWPSSSCCCWFLFSRLCWLCCCRLRLAQKMESSTLRLFHNFYSSLLQIKNIILLPLGERALISPLLNYKSTLFIASQPEIAAKSIQAPSPAIVLERFKAINKLYTDKKKAMGYYYY